MQPLSVRVLELDRVDGGVGAVHEVAVGPANDHLAEGAAQVGHVRVQRGPADRRGVLAVGRLEQRVDRDRPPRSSDQHGGDAPLLRTTEGE